MIYNIFIYDCKLPDHCYVAVMEFCKFYEVQNFEKPLQMETVETATLQYLVLWSKCQDDRS